MEEGGKVEVVNSDKGCRGAGDENADLVEEVVEWVELPVCRKWHPRAERIQEGRGDALVDGVFGDVNEEEWEHVREEQGACTAEICHES